MKKRIDVMNIYLDVEETLFQNIDFKTKKVMIGNSVTATLVFSEVLLNKDVLSGTVLKPLLQEEVFKNCKSIEEIEQKIDDGATYLTNCQTATESDDVITALLNYQAALFIEGASKVFLFESNTTNVRQISEPTNENVTKGAKDSFVETLNLNLAMIRSRLKTPNLVLEKISVGSEIPSKAAIIYVKGVADTKKVDKIRNLLLSKNIKTVSSIGVITEAITGNQRSIFPQTSSTERPDIVCSDITQGYIAIMIDGFPFAIIAPVTIASLMQVPQDYSFGSVISSLIRILRYAMMFIALSAPAIYISIMYFQQEMIPTQLAMSIIQARMEVPFNESFETLIMLIMFEVLIEASLRIPKNIGQTVSIVGGLVIGDAAVNAKIVSPFVVIIVAIAAISSFTIPNQDFSNSIRLWRFVLTVLSSFWGLFGFITGFIILTLQLCSIETLGVSFMAPFVSEHVITKDTVLRLPFKMNKKLPQYLSSKEDETNE